MNELTGTPRGEQPGRIPFEVAQIAIERELKSSYLDYAMSVIVSRAIPDLRDGLKPVHRRILYAMHESGNTHDKPFRKSARPIGDVMGKYHPHGDGAIYFALVRMAQDFSMSLPLLEGQGNFGSMDGDNPAAMRYTEVRMDRPAAFVLADIEEDTVDFQDNYDGKDQEPVVLPSRFPNVLVNGASGIAVGMATNIPTHNLGEVIDATLALIENPDLDSLQLARYIPAPDFPTGGLIMGTAGARRTYTEGRGSVIIRARSRVEEIRKDRFAIIVSEIPYQVNKSTLVEKIAELGRDRSVEGISGVSDESDRSGIRIVIELKREATPDVVLNQLFRQTPLQTSFGCNMLALNAGRPETLDLRKFLTCFIEFRNEVVIRRTAFRLRKARERSHILCGLAVAVANVDEVVRTIRASGNPAEARERLMSRIWLASDIAEYIRLIDDPDHRIAEDGSYRLSDAQARAILDLRLQRLTALGVSEVAEELKELADRIREYLETLRSRERIMSIIADELREVRELFAVPRRSEIVEDAIDLDDEDLIEREDMAVTVTNAGYIKRTVLTEYREQKRGGKGLQGMNTKDEDFVTTLFVANTHTPLLFFTTDGMVYKLPTWRLPQSGRNARGKAIVNILPIAQGVTVTAIMPVDRHLEDEAETSIVFATKSGSVRRNALSDFTNIRSNGKIAITLQEGDSLVNVCTATERDDFFLTTARGQAIRFPVTDVRVFKGRKSSGIRGIRLQDGDSVVSMAVIGHIEVSPDERSTYFRMRRALDGEGMQDEIEPPETQLDAKRFANLRDNEEWILTITANGFGKRTSAHEFRITARGGIGVVAANMNLRSDRIVASFTVRDEDRIMLVTSAGQSIRCPVDEVSRQGRASAGVNVFSVSDQEEVVSVARIADRDGDSSQDGQSDSTQ